MQLQLTQSTCCIEVRRPGCTGLAYSLLHQNIMTSVATHGAGLEEEGEDAALVAGTVADMEGVTGERVGEEVDTAAPAAGAAAAAAGAPTGAAAVATLAAVVTPGRTARELPHPSQQASQSPQDLCQPSP